MVQYRDLNAPPARALADVVADMKASERQSKTGDAGVKDLGETGDVVWPRQDGEVASIRDVDLELADARQRIETAEGDLAGAQARIDVALDAEGHVREDEILRNATLLGDTVVEQINVTDKLVGTDGVFTGTVDFANVNVTGELLANEISGEYLYGTVIEGGEIRTGTDESRGSFHLGDRAYVSPVDGYAAPGLQLRAPDREYVHPAGLGIDAGAVSVSSGRTADGRYGHLQVNRGGVSAVVSPSPDDSLQWGSRISSDSTSVRLSAGQPAALDGAEMLVAGPVIAGGQEVSNAVVRLKIAHNGKSSLIQASNGTTTVESSDGTTTRSLKIDDSGVWVTTNKSGVTESWNLEETAKDTGWIDMTFSGGHTNDSTGANFQYRLTGNVMHLRGRVRPTTGVYAQGNVYQVAVLPANLRPTATQRTIVAGGGSTQWCRLEVSASQGTVRIASMSGASDWIDLTGTSWSLD